MGINRRGNADFDWGGIVVEELKHLLLALKVPFPRRLVGAIFLKTISVHPVGNVWPTLVRAGGGGENEEWHPTSVTPLSAQAGHWLWNDLTNGLNSGPVYHLSSSKIMYDFNPYLKLGLLGLQPSIFHAENHVVSFIMLPRPAFYITA